MNDLGSLATDIVTYHFPSDTGRFPVGFVSGWLETRIGALNGITHEEFSIDETGAFTPCGLFPVEKDIFKTLYEIYYYDTAARESLRGIIWDDNVADSITMVKEGDSTVQKTSKHQISRTYTELSKMAQENLKDLVFQYNRSKASPIQVAGEDSSSFNFPWDSSYNR